MSRNAIGAMAVVLVSGFAGCAATARAETETRQVEPAAHARFAEAATPARAAKASASVVYRRAAAPWLARTPSS